MALRPRGSLGITFVEVNPKRYSSAVRMSRNRVKNPKDGPCPSLSQAVLRGDLSG